MRLKQYEWILFDADDTLFHFDAFQGLRHLFSQYDIEFTPAHYDEYQTLNKALWVKYQNGAITAKQLQQQRFQQWGDILQVSPHTLNSGFLTAMAELCTPLEGAISLLCALKDKVKLGIITNGFTELQQARLEYHGYHQHFELLVISEQVGVAKPHPDIFAYALTRMGNPDPQRVLMVGDNPDTDILGALNAGFDACWLNAHHKLTPEGLAPQHQVTTLGELEKWLLETR